MNAPARTADIIELPTAARIRARLAELEAGGPDARAAELEKERDNLNRASLQLCQMVFAVSSHLDGLEEMCDAEKARADAAEQSVIAAARVAKVTEYRLSECAKEIDQLRGEIATMKADAERAQAAHEAGIALFRELLSRRQAELEAAEARAEQLSRQLEESQAARIVDAKRALEVAVKTCAGIAASRAEGYTIAGEILALMGSGT